MFKCLNGYFYSAIYFNIAKWKECIYSFIHKLYSMYTFIHKLYIIYRDFFKVSKPNYFWILWILKILQTAYYDFLMRYTKVYYTLKYTKTLISVTLHICFRDTKLQNPQISHLCVSTSLNPFLNYLSYWCSSNDYRRFSYFYPMESDLHAFREVQFI